MTQDHLAVADIFTSYARTCLFYCTFVLNYTTSLSRGMPMMITLVNRKRTQSFAKVADASVALDE